MSTDDRQFLILGAGGHGRVVAELVRACGGHVRGFVEADAERVGESLGGVPVLADESSLVQSFRRSPLAVGGDHLAFGIGDNAARAAKFSLFPPDRLPCLVHPSAAVSPSARVGSGTVVLANAVLNASAELGAAVIVNSGAIIEHDCIVEDAAHVSPGAVLAGAVRVGSGSWIGAGATVIQGIIIGRDAVVGAGACVIQDVPDGATVVGVPARPISRER